MPQKILQINFKFHLSRAEYETAVSPLVNPVANVPGLLWKVWLMNEAEQEAGGVHLFANGESLDAYLNSDIVAGIVSNPAFSDFNVKQFEVMKALSELTRAPLAMAASS